MIKIEIVNFSEKFDDIKYKEELAYFKKYYGSEFKKNQGVENILEMIQNHSVKGSWIDLGAGSNTYFWSAAFREIQEICCVDKTKESFLITKAIRNGNLLSKCYDYIFEKYKSDVSRLFNLPINFYTANLLDGEDIKINKKYSNVSQFGLLGLSKNQEKYIRNFEKLDNFVEKGGVFLGANWIFSTSYSSKKGFTNTYLSQDLIQSIAQTYSYELCYFEKVEIEKDPNYNAVILYALEKK